MSPFHGGAAPRDNCKRGSCDQLTKEDYSIMGNGCFGGAVGKLYRYANERNVSEAAYRTAAKAHEVTLLKLRAQEFPPQPPIPITAPENSCPSLPVSRKNLCAGMAIGLEKVSVDFST